MNATPGPVIVCGMGYVGYRIVVLLRRLGEAVTVVTRDARGEWRRDAEGRGSPGAEWVAVVSRPLD